MKPTPILHMKEKQTNKQTNKKEKKEAESYNHIDLWYSLNNVYPIIIIYIQYILYLYNYYSI